MIVRIDVTRDTATQVPQRLKRKLANRRQMNLAAADGMLPLIQRNFLDLAETNHNAFGVRSSFWNRMNASTIASADDEGGYVRMPREVALRFFGGTVTPQAAANLAIPARAEAYGKSPRDFDDLRLVPFRSGALALVQAAQQQIGYRHHKDGSVQVTHGQQKGGLVFYWLVKSATINADEDVLPTAEELGAAARDSVADYLGLVGRRGA